MTKTGCFRCVCRSLFFVFFTELDLLSRVVRQFLHGSPSPFFWVFLRQLFDFRPSVQDDRDLNHAYSLASTSDTYGPYNCCRNKDLWSVHVIVEITRDSFNTFMKKIIDILAFEIYADSDDELIATCHNLMWIVKCAPCHVMILEVNSGRGSSWWKSPDVGCHQVLSRRLRWQTSTAHEYRSCYVFYMTGTRHEWHLCPLLISRSMDLRIHVDPRFELWRWIRLSLTSLSLHCSMFETSSWHYLWGLVGWTRVSSDRRHLPRRISYFFKLCSWRVRRDFPATFSRRRRAVDVSKTTDDVSFYDMEIDVKDKLCFFNNPRK